MPLRTCRSPPQAEPNCGPTQLRGPGFTCTCQISFNGALSASHGLLFRHVFGRCLVHEIFRVPDIGDARASLVHLWLLAKRGSDHASLLSVMSVSDLCVWSSKQWSLLELLFCLYVHQRPSLLCIPKNVGFSTTKDLLRHILLWIPNEARPSVRSLSWWTSFLQNFPLQMKWKKQPSTQQGKAKRSKRHNLWHNASQKQVISQVPASSWERSTNINPHLIRTNLDTSYFDSFLFKPRLLNNVVKMLASLGERKSQHFEKRIDRVRVSPHACAWHKNLIPVQFLSQNGYSDKSFYRNLFQFLKNILLLS